MDYNGFIIALTAAGALIEAVDFSVKILTTSRDLCRSEEKCLG
jgi:hypothetical protein